MPSAGEKKVEEYCTVSFRSEYLPMFSAEEKLTRDSMKEYLSSLPVCTESKSAGKPGFHYFYTKEDENANTGKQAGDCRSVEYKHFQGRDDKVGILTKLFICISTDMTGVSKKDNPILSADKAPVIVLTLSSGEIATTLSGKSISQASLVSAMSSVLRTEGINASAVLASARKSLEEIEDLEDEKEKLEETVKDIRNRMLYVEEGSSRFKELEQMLEKQNSVVAAKLEELKVVHDAFDASVNPKRPDEAGEGEDPATEKEAG